MMSEFLQECFWPVNFPLTLLLLIVLGYWTMVIVGVVGTDLFEFDFDVDGGVDADGDVHVDGSFGSFLEFLYPGEVPVVIVASFFIVSMWIITLLSNHYLNDANSLLVMGMWLVPNAVISLLATRVAMMPFATMFKNYDQPEFTRNEMLGKVGIVKTAEVSASYGQMELQQDGPPIVLNVRTRGEVVLRRGDAAKILGFNPENDTFLVELSKWEKP